eukprot:356867_1
MTIKAEDEAVQYTEKYYAETEAVDTSKRDEDEKKFRMNVEKIKKAYKAKHITSKIVSLQLPDDELIIANKIVSLQLPDDELIIGQWVLVNSYRDDFWRFCYGSSLYEAG